MEPRTAAERIERGVVYLALGAAALAITSFAAGTLLTREASLSKAPATVPAAPLFDAPASRPAWPPARKDDSLSLVRASFAAKAAVAPPASVPPRRRAPAPPANRPPAAEPRRRSEAQSTHKSLPSLTKTALETPSGGSRGSPFSATTIASTSSAASRPPVASGSGSSQRVAQASSDSPARASAARSLTRTAAAGSRQAGGDFPDYVSAGAPGSQAAADSISSSSASAAEITGLAAGTDGKSVPANASGNGTGNSDKLPDTRSGKGDDAQFVSQTAPSGPVVAGETFNVTVTMLNVGSSTWTWVSDYNLGSENPASNSKWGVSAVWLDAADSILPGEQKVFSFPVTAPTTPGTYPFQWRMARGSGGWFGDYTDDVAITVTAAP